MDKCRVYKQPDGSLVVIHPNIHKVSQMELTDEWFETERGKIPALALAVKVKDLDRSELPWFNNPDRRRFRRDAYTWDQAAGQFKDDQRITTGSEVHAAILWKQEQEILSPAASVTGRKLLTNRLDLLTVPEVKQTVAEWRASASSPAFSKFTAPADAVDPTLPIRGK